MLKKRVVIVLQLNNGILYRSKKFSLDYRYCQSFLGSEGADEVVILDVSRYGASIPPLSERKEFVDAAMAYSRFCFSPLTLGGGIRTMEDVKFAMREIGCDKVLINTAGFEFPTLVLDALRLKFGAQAVVAGIDCDEHGQVKTHQGTRDTGWAAEDWAVAAVTAGAGEIFLTSIDRDGSLRGYDLDLLRRVVAAVNVPVVIAGGCAGWQSMKEGFEAGADGCATSNIFSSNRIELDELQARTDEARGAC